MFRTIAVRAGRPLNWTWHWRRLQADCATLGIAAPAEAAVLRELREVASGDAVAKVIVTRGASGRGYAPPQDLHPTRVVAAFALPEGLAQRAEQGVAVRRCALVLSEQPRFAGAKTLNRLENVLARGEWDDAQFAEGLLADSAGRVVEGTMSNVFIVASGLVATPSLARCGVIGAQRERVRALLERHGVRCVERDLAWRDLVAADEVFLTNSVIGAWPVSRFESCNWSPGPLTRQVQRWIADDDALA